MTQDILHLHNVMRTVLPMSMTTTKEAGVPEWDLADRMRKALRAANIGVGEMAAELAMNRRGVTNYLSGRTVPRRPVLIAWAMKCGVPLGWLLTGEEFGPDTPRGQASSPPGWLRSLPGIVPEMTEIAAAA